MKRQYSIGRAVYDIARIGNQHSLRECATGNTVASRSSLQSLAIYVDAMALTLSESAQASIKTGKVLSTYDAWVVDSGFNLKGGK